MNAETFCEHFATFAEAPNGVAALRELILQLAVQGKLTPSDPNDKPASILRREMESARKRMIDDGDIRCGDDFAPVGVDEAPYALPEKWEWVRVGEVMHLINGKAFKPTDWLKSGLPIVRIQNLNNPDAPFNYSSEDVDDKVRLKNDDFLISWSGTPGTSFGAFIWNRGPAVLNQHIFRAILFGAAFIKPFLRIAVNARLDEMIAQAHGGVGLQHITKGKLERLSLPLPPLAEQGRVVEKVDQLLGLCDELAARQAAQREARSALVGATLDRLVSARSAADFPAHAHRLRDHFDRLFDTPSTLPQLRQAILQLAVQGQLVPQDPNDEPFARDRSVSEDVIGGMELPPLPETWSYWRLKHLSERVSVGHVGPTSNHYCDATVGIPFLRSQNVRRGRLDRSGLQYVTPAFHLSLKKSRLKVGDLLFVRVGANRGDCCVVPESIDELNCANIVFARPKEPISDYLQLYCQSEIARKMLLGMTTGSAQGVINTKSVAELLVPIPPLSEQKRIVSKVTELLLLCDALEAKLTQAESASTQLLSAAVHHLLRGT